MGRLEHTTKITRRAAVGVFAAAGAGFAIFGPRAPKYSGGSRVVIDYWEKWTGHEGAAMERVVHRFNESQDRIHVRYFSMNGIGQKALIAIAGGDPPDVIGLWNFSIPAYSEAGALLALDELVTEHGITKEKYAAPVWQLLTHRGKLWGLVNTCGSVALYYNKTLFREAGLDPEKPPRTIDELDACHASLTTKNASGEYERVGFLHTEPGWWSWPWGYFFGGTLYDSVSDTAVAASPANIAGYEWVQSYPRTYGASALIKFQSGLGVYGTAQHPFLAGKVAMTIQGPWLVNNIQEFKPTLDYGVTPMPVAASLYDPAQPIGLLDSDVLVIPRGAKHPAESMEFIAYTQRQEIVEELSLAHCKNSPLASISEEFVAKHPHKYLYVHDAITRSPRAFCFPRTRTWPEYEKDFNSAMQRMWRVSEPAAATLAQVQERAQVQLDRAADQRARRAARRGQS
ncbi:MAG: ABC transporter substrate-binding protein [Pyrinomonadaceae bacterium]|nr:ABC transporter substrate-binding protein [Phycisphaerales bacterium]